MATSKNAKIQIETGQTPSGAMAALTDAGDRTVFYVASGGDIWSGKSGYEPVIRPNGIVTGRNVVSTDDAGVSDTIDIAGFTAYLKGVLTTYAGGTTTITRTATTGKAQVHSVTLSSAGAIAIVEGTISASTAFSETRAAAGGPPLIPTTSIEIAQVRVTTSTAAPITSAEIFQVVGTHSERYDFPGWTVKRLGYGDKADTASEENAHIKFDTALPSIHTGSIAKGIYAQWWVPVFSNVAKGADFTPADNAHSVASEQFYGAGSGSIGTVASVSSSLGQGGFTALVSDGVTDTLVQLQDEVVTTKFSPDSAKAPYVLTQGTLGLARTFPLGGQNKVTATISAEDASVNFTS